jgi:uncharacterized phage-associated protein
MAFPAKSIANEFLTIAKNEGKELTPMKIQKLVYFAHGWYLAVTGRPLISESIQAWEYGPVIPSLYGDFREFGNSPVGFPATVFKMREGRATFSVPVIGNSGNPEEREVALQVVKKVWKEYGHYTPARLSNATHSSDSPWSKVYREGEKNIPIPDQSIREYFLKVANAER